MTLQDDWNDNKDRPAWVQANREELSEATGLDIPRSRSEIAEFLSSKKGVVTRRLGGDTEEEDDN